MTDFKPYLAGGAMAIMMMWMLHDTLMSGNAAPLSLLIFVALHIAAALAISGMALLGASRFPKAQRVIAKLHRPSIGHVLKMIVAFIAVFGLVHISVHTGIVPWT